VEVVVVAVAAGEEAVPGTREKKLIVTIDLTEMGAKRS
jgi:hypothetical protein